MSPRIISFGTSGSAPEVASAPRFRYASACMAGLRWVRDAFGLLAMATLLAWLVVRFTH